MRTLVDDALGRLRRPPRRASSANAPQRAGARLTDWGDERAAGNEGVYPLAF
jgi:hypothetical protein